MDRLMEGRMEGWGWRWCMLKGFRDSGGDVCMYVPM